MTADKVLREIQDAGAPCSRHRLTTPRNSNFATRWRKPAPNSQRPNERRLRGATEVRQLSRDRMLVDPRRGDIEDDAASPGQRSLLAIAGSLLVEISLPKLLFAWTVCCCLPAVLLGLAPLLASAWFSKLSQTLAALTGIGTAARFARDHRAGVDRMAAAVSDRREPISGRSTHSLSSPSTRSAAKRCAI